MEKVTSTEGTKYFSIVGIIFVSSLLITNIASQKLIQLGPFTFTGGIFLFPISYIFGDILTEVYGYKKTRGIIWISFLCSAFMVLFLKFVIKLNPAPGWDLQNEFEAALNIMPQIIVASLIAYLFGEFSNSIVLAKLKIRTEGKYLWVRTIGSTIIGQAADTIIFVIIAFWGIVPIATIIATIWSGYLFKVFYEIIATPLTYYIVNNLKKAEQIDVFDRGTNFNPLSLK